MTPAWLRRLVRQWRACGLDCDVHAERGPDGWPVIAVHRGERPDELVAVRAPVWKGEPLEVLTATGARLPARFLHWETTPADELSIVCAVWVRTEALWFSAGTGRCLEAPLWLSRDSFDRVRRSFELRGGRSAARRAPVGGHDAPGPAASEGVARELGPRDRRRPCALCDAGAVIVVGGQPLCRRHVSPSARLTPAQRATARGRR